VKANTLSGYISDTPFANGTMKAVFEASIWLASIYHSNLTLKTRNLDHRLSYQACQKLAMSPNDSSLWPEVLRVTASHWMISQRLTSQWMTTMIRSALNAFVWSDWPRS
jgi:hypothetical protein